MIEWLPFNFLKVLLLLRPVGPSVEIYLDFMNLAMPRRWIWVLRLLWAGFTVSVAYVDRHGVQESAQVLCHAEEPKLKELRREWDLSLAEQSLLFSSCGHHPHSMCIHIPEEKFKKKTLIVQRFFFFSFKVILMEYDLITVSYQKWR